MYRITRLSDVGEATGLSLRNEFDAGVFHLVTNKPVVLNDTFLLIEKQISRQPKHLKRQGIKDAHWFKILIGEYVGWICATGARFELLDM